MIAHGSRHYGHSTIFDPDQPEWTRDLVACGHCQASIHLVPGTQAMVYLIFNVARWAWAATPGAFCRTCMSPVCLACHAIGTCMPWEKQMEAMEAAFTIEQARAEWGDDGR